MHFESFLRRVRFCLGAVLFAGAVHSAELELPRVAPGGWIHFSSPGAAGQVHRLESSEDLVEWREMAVLHDGPWEFADVTAPGRSSRFVRVTSRARSSQDDGKNAVVLPSDPFAEPAVTSEFLRPASLGWIKFAILREDESRVWFQDSRKYPFHFEFARLRLPPFAGITRSEFDRQTLFRAGAKAVLGAILIPPNPASGDYGIQFVGQDVWTREEIARWFERVRAGVLAPPGTRPVYVPTFEQEPLALAERDWLAARGIDVASASRWLSVDAVFSEGWAVGRLVFVPGAGIAAAYASGELKPEDILLTDTVPAEVPFVSGILALNPATPNSHVAILARGWEIPFVWFADPGERQRLVALAGRDVALRTGPYFAAPHVTDLSGQLTPALRTQLANLRRPAPLRYPPKESLGTWTTNVANLTPAATRYVGGKAANYGLLRRTIPDHCGPALALTFDVWDAFLDQPLPGGIPLRTFIAGELEGLSYPPDMSAVRTRLANIRSVITRTATFSPAQKSLLLSALTQGPFEPGRKLRFRSSTNVEDAEDYTGAGLYDSYSGCLQDDLDDDTSGPSACDPEESGERGVFRAIQRVYASFYNENAFLERLRRGVSEDEVGMAVLVHHSYPDADELANGVIVLHANRSFGSLGFWGEMVSQLGAVSVSNPDSAARPERVSFSSSGGSRYVDRVESSSLVPLGGTVMTWQADYLELVRLLESVTQGYGKLFPGKTEFSLDLEFKRIRPGRLEIKQVRPLPGAATGTQIPFLFSEPTEWCVEEGEFGTPLAKHRLKCRLSMGADPRRLDAEGLATSFYRDAILTFRQDTIWMTLSNGPAVWTEFTHAVEGNDVLDRWVHGSGADRRQFELRTTVERTVPRSAPAWFTPSDFRRTLQVRYATPQPELGWEGPAPTREDVVVLRDCPGRGPGDLPQERILRHPRQKGVGVTTRFAWPTPPAGPSAGYTAPNVGFEETTLVGFTTEPVVLRAAAAQTYSPGHHNFTETFVFEPRLDPAVPTTRIAELEAAGIRMVIVSTGFDAAEWWVMDTAGALKRWP
ncbi:MAG: hypothetical protein JNL10_10585 [Verrucomicrobiales bacterium]|nr:hypothetical protein [Verrucomicrobiales bacterium]